MMKSILRQGLSITLIAAGFIGAAFWVLATPIDKTEVGNASSREKFIAVRCGDPTQAGMYSCATLDVPNDEEPAKSAVIGLFGGVGEALNKEVEIRCDFDKCHGCNQGLNWSAGIHHIVPHFLSD